VYVVTFNPFYTASTNDRTDILTIPNNDNEYYTPTA